MKRRYVLMARGNGVLLVNNELKSMTLRQLVDKIDKDKTIRTWRVRASAASYAMYYWYLDLTVVRVR